MQQAPGAPVVLTLPPVSDRLLPAEFERVRNLMREIAGISLSDGKEGLVRSRLQKRLRALSFDRVSQYLDYLDHDRTGAELALMVDVLTTNKTGFFRESDHFDLLARRILPGLADRRTDIRIWSAGCSTGEEPYTIAMVARDTLTAAVPRVRILGTDISARVLSVARAAEYSIESLAGLLPGVAARHFAPVADATDRRQVAPATRALVRLARLNLMGDWPMSGPFDLIFCRNVMIYFDKPTQTRLVQRFVELLAPGGYLLIGHSESLSVHQHGLRYVQPATYQA